MHFAKVEVLAMSNPEESFEIKKIAAEIISMSRAKPAMAVAIAGAPGSGKSTFADLLSAKIGEGCCVVPMDGFHLDNAILRERGLMSVKGAPQTFNREGFSRLVDALLAQRKRYFPTFDREADRVIEDGGMVPDDTSIFLFEGNYLLFDAQGWSQLAQKWDATIWLDVSEDILETRLIQRWIDNGLPKEAAKTRARMNDLVNAQIVIRHALPATWTLAHR